MLIAHVVQLEVTEVVRVKNDVIHQLEVCLHNTWFIWFVGILPARVCAWLLLWLLCDLVSCCVFITAYCAYTITSSPWSPVGGYG